MCLLRRLLSVRSRSYSVQISLQRIELNYFVVSVGIKKWSRQGKEAENTLYRPIQFTWQHDFVVLEDSENATIPYK